MNFDVEWDPAIRHELHELWVVATDPAAVRAAAREVEERLTVDPQACGRLLSEGLWRVHVPPLLLHYTIDTERRFVEITDVQYTG